MKEKLGITERIVLHGMLPSTGNIMELRMIRDIRKVIEIGMDEQEKLEMVVNESGYKWNPEKSYEAEYEFRDAELSFIKGVLSNLDGKKQLTENHFSLWEKFMEDK